MARKQKNYNKITKSIISLVTILIVALISNFYINRDSKENTTNNTISNQTATTSFDLNSIPEYESSPYVTLNNNIPNFDEKDHTSKSFEIYSNLDSLGRCGVAYANICKEIMPPERR